MVLVCHLSRKLYERNFLRVFFVAGMPVESKAYSEPSQTSEMERFAKTVKDF